jgi:hypothetical protein
MNVTGTPLLLKEVTISCHVCRGNTGNTICFQDMNVTGDPLRFEKKKSLLVCNNSVTGHMFIGNYL